MRRLAIEAVGLLLILIFAGLWFRSLAMAPAVGEVRPAQEAPTVKGAAREVLEGARIEAIRPSAKAARKIPPPSTPGAELIAAGRISADIRPHDFYTYLDPKTGKTQTLDVRAPAPWLAISTRGEAGIGYGYTHAGPAVRAYIRQEVFEVKGWHFKGEASLDKPTSGASASWFAGATVGYQW